VKTIIPDARILLGKIRSRLEFAKENIGNSKIKQTEAQREKGARKIRDPQ
jgi:hypothetical protein